jgi:hypothetical protein
MSVFYLEDLKVNPKEIKEDNVGVKSATVKVELTFLSSGDVSNFTEEEFGKILFNQIKNIIVSK